MPESIPPLAPACIDGEAVRGMTLDRAIEKMRGPVNTKIKLRIMRKGVEKPIDVSLKRAIIHVSSVRSRVEGNDVGYIPSLSSTSIRPMA